MKRDMDLVRQILLALEEHPHGHAPDTLAIDGYDEETIGFHVYLMDEAELLHAVPVTQFGGTSPAAMPVSIRWKGYEFLDAARQETAWNRAKSIVARAGGATLQTWIEVLTKIGLERMTGP